MVGTLVKKVVEKGAEKIFKLGEDFFRIKPGKAGDKIADVLKGKGGKVVTKPPKGVNPTTVTPGNVAGIVRGGTRGFKPNIANTKKSGPKPKAKKPDPKPKAKTTKTLTKNQKDAIAGRGKYKTKPKAKAKPPSVSTNSPTQPKAPKIGTGSNSPKGTKVTRPKTPRNPPKKLKQPQSADSGKFQKPSPAPKIRPKVKPPAVKPRVKTTSPASPKTPSLPRTGSNFKAGESRIVGVNPRVIRDQNLKLGTLDFEPDFVLKDPPAKKYDKGPGGDQHPPVTKKKEPVVKKTEGKMTLRKYLNDAIKKRGSSLTAEKKNAGKYKSIAAAKKAGSLYYTNKSGKVMAAVYAEDLKK